MTKKLLLLFLQMGKTHLRTAPDSTKIAIFASSVAGIFVTILLCTGTAAVAYTIPKESLSTIFAYAFSGLLAFNILFGVPQVFKNLYGTNDLAFLFTLPIKTRSIYWVKFIQSFIGVPGIIWIFSVILLTVFGIAGQASGFFFPVAYIVSLLITLIGMSITYLLNLILIQIIPVHRAKELMTVMSALAGIIVYVLFQLPNLLVRNQVDENMMNGMPQMPKWIPLEWGGRSLYESFLGTNGFILPMFILIILTVFLLFLSSSLVEKGFRTGWIKMNEGSRPKKKRKGTKVTRKLHHPIIAIGLKEGKSIQRDMREWVTFLPFIFFMFFPVITIFNEEGSIEFIINHPDISWIIAQATFLFMFTFLTANFSSSSIAREAYSIHLLRVLPLSGWNIALGKFWMNWLIPILFLSVLEITGGIFLKWGLLDIVSGIIVLAVLSLGITGIGLWLGSIGAKYNPNNPQNRLETGVSFLLMFLSFAYLFIAALPTALILIPSDALLILQQGERSTGILGLFVSLIEWKAEHKTALTITGGLLTLLISIGAAYFTLYLSARRIEKGLTINFVSTNK